MRDRSAEVLGLFAVADWEEPSSWVPAEEAIGASGETGSAGVVLGAAASILAAAVAVLGGWWLLIAVEFTVHD